jgi:glutamate 5-kinase
MSGLVDALAAWQQAGSEVILVSSGAIAVGAPFLKLSDRPQDLATQQAAAAVGQNLLMGRYQALFEKFSIIAGQVLLTVGDMENGTHRTNALRTIERFLGLGIIPIVNENDTVATQEIRFGDNDRLAALVSELVSADLLVLLSDVDALYTTRRRTPEPSRLTRLPLAIRWRVLSLEKLS